MSKCDCNCCKVIGPLPDLEQEKKNIDAMIKMAKLRKKR